MLRTVMDENFSSKRKTTTKTNEKENDPRSRSRRRQKKTNKRQRENRTYICREGSRPHERYTIYVQLLLLGTNVIGQE